MAMLFPAASRRLFMAVAIAVAMLICAAAQPAAAGEVVTSIPFGGAPAGASAYRIRYRSTDKDGRPIVVSGAVIVPGGPAPAGGRLIVAWAHGASGIAEGCGLSDKPALFAQIAGLNALLAAGYMYPTSM